MNFIESLLRPVNSTHFSHSNNNWCNSKRLSKKSMLSGLAISYKTCLEFSRFGRNDKNSNISLTCTHNHIRDIIFMTWSIEQGKSSFTIMKSKFRILNGNAFHSFSRINISNTCKLPSFHMILFRFLFISHPLLFVNLIKFLQDIACQCGLTWIYMSNKDEICILFSEYL